MGALKRIGGVIAVIGVVASLSACANDVSGTSTILRVGTTSSIDSLNPFVSDSDYSSVIYQYVYPHLTEYNEDLEIVGSFATDWETSANGTVWTFHTVPDATWSDGEKLTAHDAEFTLNTVMEFKDGAAGIVSGWVNHLSSAVATDDNTLVLTYDSPVANALTQMQTAQILPQHVWEEYASGDGSQLTSFENSAPIVSGGPFQLDTYKKDQIVLFSANKHWWGPTKPWISGFGFQFFANDDAMVTALKTNQLDMIGQMTPPTAVESLQKAGMTVLTGPSVTIKNLIINTNPDKTKNRELLNPRVREAMEYAINRQEIVDTSWLGYADPGSTVVTPASGFHNETVTGRPFDQAKANQILDELGYTRGNDGIRVAEGNRMEYELIFPTEENGAGDRTFQTIQAGLDSIGIKVTQRKMDPDAATDAIMAPDGEYLDYDLAMWNWTPPVDPDFILSTMTCAALGHNSDSGYCNPAYDALYALQATQLDENDRRTTINEMEQILFDDRPYIVLTYPQVIEAHNPAWDGFILSPLVGSINNLSTLTLLGVHRIEN
jgi:peptide/nickel transport system substrate-binding protein